MLACVLSSKWPTIGSTRPFWHAGVFPVPEGAVAIRWRFAFSSYWPKSFSVVCMWIPGQNKATSRSSCHCQKQTPWAINENVRLNFVDRKANLAQLRLQFRGKCDITLCVHDIHTKSESWRVQSYIRCTIYTAPLKAGRTTTSSKKVETLSRENDLSCFKSLLVRGLWDIIIYRFSQG